MILNKALLKKEFIKRQLLHSPTNPFPIKDFLFKEQFDFISDPSPFKTAVCSRRSGKTISCAADLIHTAINTIGVTCLYLTLSRSSAKRIVWKELQNINQIYNLKGKENISELSIVFPNRSVIYLSGANDKSEIEKFRGLPIKLCYIDEAQAFKSYIQDLIDDVIAPALIDYAGSLCLIGTPGPLPSGYFYNCSTNSKEWSHHAWTFWQNPYIKQKSGHDHKFLFDREIQRRGVGPAHPSIQREWFGKWVLDSESLLIHYNESINHYKDLPKENLIYIMGIDLGFNDADAIAVVGWCEKSPVSFLVEEVVVKKQGLTELVNQIKTLQSKYNIAKMMIDEGGLGKKLAEEMRRRHQIPVQAADKVRKMETIEFLNDALRTGRFMAKKDSRFAQDSLLVEIDRDKSTPDKIKVSDRFHSDIIDATLYAFKESPSYSYQIPALKHPYRSVAWAEQEAKEMEERALEYFSNLEKNNDR